MTLGFVRTTKNAPLVAKPNNSSKSRRVAAGFGVGTIIPSTDKIAGDQITGGRAAFLA
jgi:hypothetical protein